MTSYTTFGDFIRKERDRAELGLREAARALDISPSYLSRLEAGELRPPSGVVLVRMAVLYGSDRSELIDKAKSREHEVIAADAGVAPAVQAFYRLAHDQSPEVQERMLSGAIGALDLSEAQKEKLIAQLRAALSRTQGKDLPRRATENDGLFAFDIAPRFLSLGRVRAIARGVLKKVFGLEIPIPVPVETVIRKFDKDILLIVHDEIEGGRLRDGSPAVLGLSRWSSDGRRRELVIHADLFDTDISSARRRANFTMGHELFHCVEHLPLAEKNRPEIMLRRRPAFVSLAPQLLSQPWFSKKRERRRLSTHEDWREWQANQFAAELMMPAEILGTEFREMFGSSALVAMDSDIEEFADQIARRATLDDLGHEISLVDRFDVNPQAMAIRLMSLGLVVDDVQS